MVCQTLDLCDIVSHKHGLDAVTYEGDRVSSQGAMTGGYQDPSKYVRLKLSTQRKEAQLQLQTCQDRDLPELERQVQESSRRLESLHQRKRDAQSLRQARRAELSGIGGA